MDHSEGSLVHFFKTDSDWRYSTSFPPPLHRNRPSVFILTVVMFAPQSKQQNTSPICPAKRGPPVIDVFICTRLALPGSERECNDFILQKDIIHLELCNNSPHLTTYALVGMTKCYLHFPPYPLTNPGGTPRQYLISPRESLGNFSPP